MVGEGLSVFCDTALCRMAGLEMEKSLHEILTGSRYGWNRIKCSLKSNFAARRFVCRHRGTSAAVE